MSAVEKNLFWEWEGSIMQLQSYLYPLSKQKGEYVT